MCTRDRTSTPLANPPKQPWRVAAAIVVVVLIVYIPATRAGFIWDDDLLLTANPNIPRIDGLPDIWKLPAPGQQYEPVVLSSYWLEYRLWEFHPTGYHVVNILLHALNSLLLWRLLERLEVPGALLAAAVFALHPVHVESVAWVAERKNTLSGAFYLSAALTYFRFCPPKQSPQPYHWRWYPLVLFLYLCAILSKTVTCTLPAAILVITWWRRGCLRWRDVLPLLPMFAIGMVLGLQTVYLEKYEVRALGHEWDFSFVDRLLIAGRALWFYAGKLVWPHPLIFTYPRWRIDSGVWWQYLFPVAAIGLVVLLWLLRKKVGRGPLAAVLLFGGTLFPALGFFNVYPMQFSFVADHFQYLASVGLIALLVAGAVKLFSAHEGPAVRLLSTSAAIGLLAVLAVLTWRQQAAYRDLEALWTDTLAKNPSAWMAYNNRGLLYYKSRNYELALADYNKSIEVKPDNADAYYNRGLAYQQLRNSRRSLVDYAKAIELQPAHAMAYNNQGVVYEQLSKYNLALASYARAIELTPEKAEVYNNVAWLRATCPDPKYRDGEMAVSYARKACVLSGWEDVGMLDTLAAAYAESGQLAEAVKWQTKAVELAQGGPQAGLRSRLELYQAGQPYRQEARSDGAEE